MPITAVRAEFMLGYDLDGHVNPERPVLEQ